MTDSNTDSAAITCHSTKWYLWQRVVPMSLLPLLMSAWFYYDHKMSYPKKLAVYQQYLDYKQQGRSEDWIKLAAEKGYNQKPDEMTEDKVAGQLHWSIGAGILGLISSAYYLLNAPKKLKADADSFTTPWGRRVPFAAVHRIDKRKWDHKGLAYVFYKEGDAEKQAIIDDLRFKGADKILANLEANFSGEVITRIKAEEGSASETEGDATA